jgi:hypothetical protein
MATAMVRAEAISTRALKRATLCFPVGRKSERTGQGKVRRGLRQRQMNLSCMVVPKAQRKSPSSRNVVAALSIHLLFVAPSGFFLRTSCRVNRSPESPRVFSHG